MSKILLEWIKKPEELYSILLQSEAKLIHNRENSFEVEFRYQTKYLFKFRINNKHMRLKVYNRYPHHFDIISDQVIKDPYFKNLIGPYIKLAVV